MFFAVVRLHRPNSNQFKTNEDAQRGKTTNQRCARHHQARNERSDSALLDSIDLSIPSKNVEVRHAVHMSRVDLSSERVEVVLDEERVPGVDEINGDIVADLKVTI